MFAPIDGGPFPSQPNELSKMAAVKDLGSNDRHTQALAGREKAKEETSQATVCQLIQTAGLKQPKSKPCSADNHQINSVMFASFIPA